MRGAAGGKLKWVPYPSSRADLVVFRRLASLSRLGQDFFKGILCTTVVTWKMGASICNAQLSLCLIHETDDRFEMVDQSVLGVYDNWF